MIYLATSINESPVITDKAGAVIEDVRGKAVKFNADGNIVLAGTGEAPLGVGIMTNDKNIAVGADVDIQIKDIGMIRAGAVIAKGDELAVNENGAFIPAAEGQHVAAIAFQAAATADIWIKARLMNYIKGGSASSGGTGVEIGGVAYETLSAAIEAAKDGDTLTLAGDVNLTETLPIDKNLTVDLNGKTLTSDKDIYAKAGTLTIQNGTVHAKGDTDAFVVGDYVGGTEKATGDAALVIGEGVTVIADNQCCVYVRGSEHNASVTTAGNLTAVSAPAIMGNGIAKGDVTITGGSLVAENSVAIYQPQDGTLTISGGDIRGKVGIELRAGDLNVTGGTINGAMDVFSGMKPNGNGSTVESGVAVAISQHNTNKDIHVNISGGTLTGLYALYEEDVQDEATDNISINITGGTFNGDVSSENVSGFIAGGLFSNAVADGQCAEGYASATKPDANGYYTIVKQ